MWLREFFKDPKMTASVSPSSVFLSQKMAEVACILPHEHILEVGVGGGAVTQSLVGLGSSYLGIDLNQEFVKKVQALYPHMTFVQKDAREISSLVSSPVDVVVSSLGLRSMSESLIGDIYTEFVKILSQNGRIVQYTYGMKDPLSDKIKENLGLKSTSCGWIARNIPPAQVFLYTQK